MVLGEKGNLSEEAKKILYEHWLKTLNYGYLTETEEKSKDVNYQKEDIILVQSSIDTEQKLMNTPISSEPESGNFSADEANQLVILIRDKSGEVIKKVKEIKSQNQSDANWENQISKLRT